MKHWKLLLLILAAGLGLHACASSEKTAYQSPEELRQQIQELDVSSEEVEREDRDRINPENNAISLSSHLKRVPGLQVQSRGGVTEVRVRGVNSLQGNIYPLFVVNGSQIGHNYEAAERSVNVNDIDYIKVLRGNDATLRYGSRGASGVVEIFTKN